jgi:putative hemolysin
LLKQQVDLYEDLPKHLQSEIDLYCTLAEEEKTAHTHVLEAAASARPSSHETATGRRLAEDMHAASDTVDEKLALKFTIYSNEISHYGYSFQAHRIRTQALPQALDYADRNRDSLTKFDERWASTISELKPKPSKQWKERAAYVNMASEYCAERFNVIMTVSERTGLRCAAGSSRNACPAIRNSPARTPCHWVAIDDYPTGLASEIYQPAGCRCHFDRRNR